MVDINKPRGKMSAYAYYVKISREELMKKQPGQFVDFTEFSETCSQGWRDLKCEDKKKFEDMARTDMERYNREMKSYIPSSYIPSKKPARRSAFFTFISDKRDKIKELNLGSIGEKVMALGKLWNELNPEDRAPYERKAAQLGDKYN